MADDIKRKDEASDHGREPAEPVKDRSGDETTSRRRMLATLAGVAGVGALAAAAGTGSLSGADIKKKITARIQQEMQEHDYLNDPLGYDKSTHDKYVTS